MTSTASHQDTKDPAESAVDLRWPVRSAEEPQWSLAETQRAMLKNLVTAQLTALEVFERLMASMGPASEALMNGFCREFMLGLFRLYPVGQEMGRHSLKVMTELTREFATVLRSALAGVDGMRAFPSEAAGASADQTGAGPE